jgi:hypothetical protein
LLMADGRALAFGSMAELGAQVGTAHLPLEETFVKLLERRTGAA